MPLASFNRFEEHQTVPTACDLGELIYAGSVKDIYESRHDNDALYFHYSNAYSVFDWGRMPDELEGKGEALHGMANSFFDLVQNPNSWQRLAQRHPELIKEYAEELAQLQVRGLAHHRLGNIQWQDQDYLKVERVSVIRPSYDTDTGRHHYYPDAYARARKALIPLEVIFRWGAPAGSSLLKRIKLAENSLFEKPMIEFSTKLEPEDRLLTGADAQWISGLGHSQWQQLQNIAALCAWLLKDFFASTGIILWDGKLEFARANGAHGEITIMLVDSIGPDELRLSRDGKLLSKEMLRDFYRPTEWYTDLGRAKQLGREQHVQDWHQFCVSSPQQLSADLKLAAEAMYRDLAQQVQVQVKQYCS